MITDNFTDIELRDELFKHKRDIISQLSKVVLRPDYIRTVKKAAKFPFNYLSPYKSSRGNRYIIMLTPTDRKRGASNPLTIVYTKLQKKEGIYAIRYDIVNNHITIFSPHFFSRYRTRFLKNEDYKTDILIDKYMQRNANLSVTKDSGLPNEVMVGACEDGLVFVKRITDGVSIALTFVSKDLLKDGQIPQNEQLLKIITEHLEEIQPNK